MSFFNGLEMKMLLSSCVGLRRDLGFFVFRLVVVFELKSRFL